ncbi:hypothetical protein C8Q76DRAFT_697381 [Earliella scabrosa]|nr:hypothetical protein C8Q76DRAFT_697381 [Earliella scabrosa]
MRHAARALLKRPFTALPTSDAGYVALANTIGALENGRGLVGLAGVPGLTEALDLLIGTLKKVEATKANKEAVKGLCEDATNLCDDIEGVAKTVRQRVEGIPCDSPDRGIVENALSSAKNLDLNIRIDGLKKQLDEVLLEARTLADKPWFTHFLRTKQDADAITRMREKINNARQNFQLQGGIAIEVVARQSLRAITKEADERVLEKLSPLGSASYRSGDNAGKAQYLQATRKNVFRELNAWVEQSSRVDAEDRVFVLVGAAGTGKSTIASELCRQLDDSKRLGASFFFTRGLQGPNSALSFFNTIAFQLATLLDSDALHNAIVSAAREHLKRGGGSQQQQMEYACEDLVRGPLGQLFKSESNPHSPIFVVVDALDECTAEDIDAVPTLLKLLLSCTEYPSSPLRILLTSRPEPDSVRHILNTHPSVLRQTFRDIGDQTTVDRDIEALIRNKLSKHPTTLSWSDADPKIIRRIVHHSEGVFVYASTAVEFLQQGHLSKELLDERLGLLLSPDRHMTLPRLHNLYLTVLETAFPAESMYDKQRARLQLVLNAIAVGRNDRVWRLAGTIGVTPNQFMSILDPLQAVIDIRIRNSTQGPKFRIMHTTFRDFLLDPEKTKALPRPEFHVDAAQAHATLALGCMRLGLYYVEKYMPELLEESADMLELCKLEGRDLRDRLRENLGGKKVDEPEHSVYALVNYVRLDCAYHRGLSTSVQSVEMIETARRFDQIPTNVFRKFIRAVGSVRAAQHV